MLTDPSHPRAFKTRAAALLQTGHPAEARQLLEALCQQQVADPEAWYLLGTASGLLGQHQHCAECCQRALALRRRYPEAQNSLGNALTALGRLPEAETAYRAALKLNGRYADAQMNLAQVLHHQGRMAEAETQYRRFLRLKPDSAPMHHRLGLTLMAQSRHAEAETAFRAALRLKPDFVEAHNSLGTALRALNRLAEAEAAYRAALRLKPEYADSLVNLGVALHQQNKSEEALETLEQAVRLNPGSAEAHNNLGNIYVELDRLGEALASYQEALRLNPDSAETYNNLAHAYFHHGELDEAIACYRQAFRLDLKHMAVTYSSFLFILNYHPAWTPRAIFDEHRHWGETYAPRPEKQPPHTNTPEPERRLRVGYVTPDLRSHSVAYFIEPILARHDRDRYEIFCYIEMPRPKHDATTERLKKLCAGWVDTCGLSDRALAERMRSDGIDILVDLAGHTAHNRIQAFAYRPAPVQPTYLGYCNTTGLPAIDYRLTDEWADPPGQDAFHTERLVRLAGGFLCYRPPDAAPEIAPLPALAAGHVTFGSFNILEKTNRQVVALWARVLRALPEARLVLKNRSWNSESLDPGSRERYYAWFAEHGVAPERIELIGWLPDKRDHLRLYSRIDIGLDTFPYNGTTTTCEALWMGVPVLALAGDRHAARVGVSLMTRLGLNEFIARDADDYVARAVALARDHEHLVQVRTSLRDRMRASTLCDAAAFTAELERNYREMWIKWCAGERHGDRLPAEVIHTP